VQVFNGSEWISRANQHGLIKIFLSLKAEIAENEAERRNIQARIDQLAQTNQNVAFLNLMSTFRLQVMNVASLNLMHTFRLQVMNAASLNLINTFKSKVMKEWWWK
jgi:hypothetical protein